MNPWIDFRDDTLHLSHGTFDLELFLLGASTCTSALCLPQFWEKRHSHEQHFKISRHIVNAPSVQCQESGDVAWVIICQSLYKLISGVLTERTKHLPSTQTCIGVKHSKHLMNDHRLILRFCSFFLLSCIRQRNFSCSFRQHHSPPPSICWPNSQLNSS